MADVVVTVPMGFWEDWIAEGDLPGDDPADSPLEAGDEWGYTTGGALPDIEPGERVYIIAHGKLRGYAPLTELRYIGKTTAHGRVQLGRRGGAVACTIDEPIRGFRGWRYRWWDRVDERPFPDWKTEGARHG